MRSLEDGKLFASQVVQELKAWIISPKLLGPLNKARRKPAAERANWEARAETYFEETKVIFNDDEPYHLAQNDFLAELQSLKWGSILEIGCGYGWHLRPIVQADPGKLVVGGDFSGGQLWRAQEFLHGLDVMLVQLDIRHLPFSNKQFDLVFSSGALCYIHPSEFEATLREIRRVARYYVISLEYAEEHANKAERRRMALAEWYSHRYEHAYQRAGLRVLKSFPFRAFKNHPVRTIPWSFVLGEVADDNGGR